MAQFDVRPRRALGQNFLIDSNILGVIGRAAELDGADVVLEIGGGLGVLSEYLAARVAYLHVVELDVGLEPALRDALGPFAANSTLHLIDAMPVSYTHLDVYKRQIDEYGPDALRHYLFREVTFGADGPVSLEGFRSRYETELATSVFLSLIHI